MTTNGPESTLPIPIEVSELTAEWFSQVLDSDVTAVDVIEAHSGTTGRARVRLTARGAVPERRSSSNCSPLLQNNAS